MWLFAADLVQMVVYSSHGLIMGLLPATLTLSRLFFFPPLEVLFVCELFNTSPIGGIL